MKNFRKSFKNSEKNSKRKFLEMSQYTLELAMEVVDDFRILFDFMLPLILLYGPERQQYKRLRENATVNSQAEPEIKLAKQEVKKVDFSHL